MELSLEVVAGAAEGTCVRVSSHTRFVVGRAPDANLCIEGDSAVSRHHFVLEIDPPNVGLRDLESRNGTFVGSRKSRVDRGELQDGDIILVGGTEILVSIDAVTDCGVRCSVCGSAAPNQAGRSAVEEVTFICPPCQARLRQTPPMPFGYLPLRELGRGDMGVVYLARHKQLGVERAIKLVLPDLAMSKDTRSALIAAAAQQAKLDHERIVQVFDLQQAPNGMLWVLMEHVPGTSLHALLDGQPMSISDALSVALQLLDGLAFAHQKGVVHRDLKPSNIVVAETTPPSVKIIDFGVAAGYQQFATNGILSISHSEFPAYMAPEQVLDFNALTPAADLYSLAALLYRAVSGVHALPFAADRDPLLVILEDSPVPLSQRLPGTGALDTVLMKGLDKRPAQRFSSAVAMRDALAPLV